ncbi:DNA-directed DNA polymerase epsilon, subunit B, partial [Ascosphaera acerosa]
MQSGFRASKLTAIANLLGRSGSSHYVLGMLQAAPTGGMLLADLTGSVALDLTHARAVPEDGAWYTPGMFVIIYGVYEEDEVVVGAALASNQGVGGTIGGKFFAVVVAGPPCERREHTLGISAEEARGGTAVSAPALAAVPARLEGGYGWVDFLGVGSERAVGAQMRQLQARCLQKALSSSQADGSAGPARRRKIVILSELNLDVVSVTAALEKVLAHYSPAGDEDPMNVPPCFVLMGSFVQYSRMPGSDTPASDEYKHGFDSLAAVLARFPAVLRNSTFVFVPGDNDPWAAAHSGGASTPVPRDGLSKLFTARVNRAFAEANREVAGKRGRVEGKVVWASNPARICLFGPTKELVVFRDDMSGRLRRNAISLRGPAKDAGDTNMDVDEGADADADAHADAMEVDEPEAQPTVTSSADPTSPQQHQQQQQQDGPASSHTSVPPSLAASRKLVKTILDQGHLSPFPLLTRPVLAGYA